MSTDRPDVRIRPARREDIPGIVSAATTSVSEEEVAGFGAPSSENPFEDPVKLASAWKDPNVVRGEEVLVAEVEGSVVGYVTVEDRGEALELVNIDVDRDRQSQGIGTRLVRFVEDRARKEGRRVVTLGTSRNAAGVPWKSLPWWQSLGYRITGEEENAWTRSIGLGAREIRMRKDLTPTSEVQLRDVTLDDLPIFFKQQRDTVANRMAAFTAKDPGDMAAFNAHWAKILEDSTVVMKMILFEGRVAGTVGSFLDRGFGKPEVTYWIEKEFWDRGLATTALAAFLAQHKVRPIYARAARDNVASIRVLEKCGFTIVGYDKGCANARGEDVEEVILELRPDVGGDSPG